MAHMVTCTVCGKRFDRDKEDAIQTAFRRYAHVGCVKELPPEVLKEQKDKDELYQYIKVLNPQYDYVVTSKVIEKYKRENNFTYSGMRKTLYYYYEVKKHKTDGEIKVGIIPYIYKEANEYYYNIFLIEQKNKEQLDNFKIEQEEIKITSPRVYIKPHKMFDMEEG